MENPEHQIMDDNQNEKEKDIDDDDNDKQSDKPTEKLLDPFGYTKQQPEQQQSQTSEIFKIEINNLPANLKYPVS